ncbi:MAG: cytochrome P450 [Alphaproteobacteria bacterium]|nr:cytochrome P450 [Alphaproteobacteria bacterium]
MNAPFVPPRPPVAAAGPSLPGFLAAVRSNALGMWGAEAYEQDVVVGRAFGRPMLLLNAPAAIHHVLVENPGGYRRTPASIRILWPITGRGLLLAEGEAWRLQRRTTAPALAPRTLPLLLPHMAGAVEAALPALRAQAAAGPVNLLAAMQGLALDVAARAMFSLESARFGAAMRELLGQFGQRMARPRALDLVLPPWLPSPGDIARLRFRRRWVALMDGIMAARTATPAAEGPRDLFDLMRAARDPETGAGFSRAELRDQMATLIVAGHETTALALFWSLYLLARDHEAQARLAAEVAGRDLGASAAAEAMPKLAYTAAVVSEALRLFPPAFTLVRQARQADRAGDIAIPRGAVVMVAPWVLHRHRRLWTDPDAFVPERFLPGATPPPRFAYLPFGAGPRVCVGAQFALAEAALVLARLMQAFHVSMADDRPVLPAPVITTQPDHAPGFLLAPR